MSDQAPTFYGNPITPKLTKEQTDQAIALLAEGKSMASICETLGVSIGRIRQLRAKRTAAEAQALLQATKNTPTALNLLREGQSRMIALLDNLVAEVARVTLELRKANKALYRRQMENKRLREERAKDRQLIRDLKKFYHGKTGREWP